MSLCARLLTAISTPPYGANVSNNLRKFSNFCEVGSPSKPTSLSVEDRKTVNFRRLLRRRRLRTAVTTFCGTALALATLPLLGVYVIARRQLVSCLTAGFGK